MAKISKSSNNWPDNPILDGPTYNVTYTDIETVGNNLGDGNVRTEGVHTRNLEPNVLILFQGSQYNNYEADLGATPIPAGTNYGNKSDDGVNEQAINHNISGIRSTVAGVGTKLQIDTAVQSGDIIRVSWQVKVWKSRPNTNSSGNVADLSMHASDVITTATRSDGAGDGSGVGEWCYLIYPKVNVTSDVLTDADFDTVSDANLYYATVVDPKIAGSGLGNGLNMASAAFDHCSVVDMDYMSSGNTAADWGGVAAALGDDASTSGYRRPYTISGGITLKANTSTTLYGIQLFASGVWRMNATTTNAKLFREDTECDPVNSRFGVSRTVTLEAASVDVTIMRGV
tara:strand:- start:4402 stop:5430 length:1029 start_codon:yes stop_codon:yes gene_type:complete